MPSGSLAVSRRFACTSCFACPQSGEHVKVVHGQYEGETGMVVRVEGPVCYIFTDATQQEIRVFARDLTLAVASASAVDS